MLIARVKGSAVSTVKDPSLTGSKLLLVQETDPSGELGADLRGRRRRRRRDRRAGPRRYRQRGPARAAPATRAATRSSWGILDSMDVDGTVSFRKS